MSTFLKKTKEPKAFTLVETLVAISIIMVAIIGPFSQIENNINAAYITRDEIIANSLAQEGIEYAYFVRDNNYLTNRENNNSALDFMAYMDGTPSGSATNCLMPNVCTIDPTIAIPSYSQIFALCSNGICSPLNIRSGGSSPDYTYTQQSGTGYVQSKFTRSFQFCYMNGSTCENTTITNEAKVMVTVAWTTLGKKYSITDTDYLQNWLQ